MVGCSSKILSKINHPRQDDTDKVSSVKTSMYSIGDIRVHPIVLDMDNVEMVSTPYKFKQYDFGTSFLDVQLLDDDIPIDLSDINIVGVFKHTRGDLIIDGGTVSESKGERILVDKGVIRLSIPMGTLRYTGTVQCEVLLFDKIGNRSTSPRISFSIEASLYNHEGSDGDIISSDNYPILISLMNDVNTLHYNTEELISNTNILHEYINSSEQVRVDQENKRQESINKIESDFNSKMMEATLKIEDVDISKNNMVSAVTSKVMEATYVISDIQSQFNALSPSESTNAEVQLARRGLSGEIYNSLAERLNAVENNPYILFETVEG